MFKTNFHLNKNKDYILLEYQNFHSHQVEKNNNLTTNVKFIVNYTQRERESFQT